MSSKWVTDSCPFLNEALSTITINNFDGYYSSWSSIFLQPFITTHSSWRNPLSLMANVLDCSIVLNKFKLQSRYYIHFRTTLEKGNGFFIPQLWVKQYLYCSSTKIPLALNNPLRLICFYTKKSIQTNYSGCYVQENKKKKET